MIIFQQIDGAVSQGKMGETIESLQQSVRTQTEQLQRLQEQLASEMAERKIVAQQLASSEHQLRAILASIMDAVFTIEMGDEGITNIDIAPTHLNQCYGDRQQWLDQVVRAFFTEQTATQWQASIQAALAAQITTEADHALTLDSGETIWLAARITPLDGQRVVWVARDISDRKQAESALRAKNAQLEATLDQLQRTQAELIASEKLAVLGQLVASIAHELNTPLGVINASIRHIHNFAQERFWQWGELWQTYSDNQRQQLHQLVSQATQQLPLLSSRERRQQRKQLQQDLEQAAITDPVAIAPLLVDLNQTEIQTLLPLLQQPDAPDLLRVAYQLSTVQTSIEQITTATDRAAKIVQALRNYSHRDRLPEFKPVDVVANLDTVLVLYHNTLKRGIEVVRDYPTVVPPVWGDGDRLYQVWNNIIRNALQAMPQGGTLTLQIQADEQYLTLQISDTGPGISPEILSHIFQPFFTTRAQGEGTGLGLDIAWQIIEQHQGQIQVSSEPGATAFSVMLPLASIHQN